MLDRKIHFVNLGAEAVAASTPYVLVDLSDTTNFDHDVSNFLMLLGLWLNAEQHGNGIFDIWVGVVTENDASDGTAQWVHAFHLESDHNPTDSKDRFAGAVDFTLGGSRPEGIDCSIVSSAMSHFKGNQSQADSANWQNDTNRASPVGATTKPGAGDIVAWAEEVGDGGTLDFSLTACYAAG